MQRWINAADAIKSIAGSYRTIWTGSRKGLKKELEGRYLPKTEALYPSWLLPEPLRLATVGNSPVYQGKLTRLAGPQRLEASGWLTRGTVQGQGNAQGDIPPAIRDYFIYRSPQASLLWIYSERLAVTPQAAAQRAWYLHGFFA